MKICSLNVRGLGDKVKRRSVFSFLKKQKADIFLLQETHLVKDSLRGWELEWGGRIFASYGETNARGAAILLHPRYHAHTTLHHASDDGRFVCIVTEEDGKKYCIANIYAPNSDDDQFFVKIIEKIDAIHDHDYTVLGGDFNMVMDAQIDRNNSNRNHEKALGVLSEYMSRVNLTDIWRVRNQESRRFTWHRWGRNHEPICSRIDMLLVSGGLVDSVKEASIGLGHFTDHSLISVTIKVDHFKRGAGVWKFNNQLLLDETFCDSMIDVINDSAKCPSLDDNEIWENIKMEIGIFSKQYSRVKASEGRIKYNKLVKLKQVLEADMLRNPSDHEIIDNYEHVVADIEMHDLKEAEKIIFRSKCKYVKDGEKNTSYFLSLEKSRYMEKNMKCIMLDDGKTSTNQNKILTEMTRFYKELYSSDEAVKFNMVRGENEAFLRGEIKRELDKDFMKDEFFDAVMTLKGGKVPGLDGLSIEFYRKFWKVLSPYLIKMYRYSYQYGLLPQSVREGVISLLPKGNKDSRYIKNKRPLTICNNDYKILAKAIDNRLKLILPDIINSDQSGFMKGRKICYNVRRSLDIIEWTKIKKIPGLILSIDMAKCFDRLEHRSIFGSLRYFNFGESIIRWISLFYNKFTICTQNFGILSKKWVKNRGTNQGCPLSPSLYLLTAEIMANKLRSNAKIKGLKVNNVQYLISQFADDTDLYLSFDQETVTNTFKTLSDIEKSTGLLVSYDKTTMYRIGSISNSNVKLITQRKISWSNSHINTLGVNISNNLEVVNDNISDVIQKMKAVSSMWYYRNMTLTGKVLIINSLMASLFVYRMQVISLIREKDVNEVNKVISDFLWKGKKAKIKLSTLKCSKADGGLGLVDIRAKHEALLYNWIVDCKRNYCIKNMADSFLNIDSNLIWECNLTGTDSKCVFTGKSFWHELAHRWNKFNYHEPTTSEQVKKQLIFFNSYIRVNGKVIIDKKWYTGKYFRIEDFLKSNGHDFLSYETFRRKYSNVPITWLEYGALLKAIPRNWKVTLSQNKVVLTAQGNKFDKIGENVKVSKMFYLDITNTSVNIAKCRKMWLDKANIINDEEMYVKHFRNVYSLTNTTKYRDFQFRLLHNKIFCNDVLVHWKKVETNICNLCEGEKQTITHLMYFCPVVKLLWRDIESKCAEFPCVFGFRNILFNLVMEESPCHIVNLIVLITKQYIFRCKCFNSTPNIAHLYAEIKNVRRIELYNALSNGDAKKVRKRWQTVQNLF